MANDKIDVVVGKKAFDEVGKLKIELEGLIKTFNELYSLTKQSGGNPFGLPKQGTAKAAKQGLTELEKASRLLSTTNEKLAISENKIVIELARKREELRINNLKTKQSTQETNKTLGAYTNLTAKLRTLRREYKDVASAEGVASKKAQRLAKEVNKLDSQVKRVDKSVGQFQRNVGNYPKGQVGLKKLGLGFKNLFTGLVAGLGVIQGVRAAFNFAKESLEVSREMKGVQFAFARLGAEGEDAFKRVKLSTRGLLSDLKIKSSLVDFENFNISLKESDTLFEFLAVRAAQTGKSVDSLKDSLVEGLSKESKLRIDNLGISAKELNDELAITPNFVKAVANIAKREVAQAGDILDKAGNSQEKFNASITNFQASLGSSSMGQASEVFLRIGSSILNLITPTETLTKKIQDQQLELFTLENRLLSTNIKEGERLSIIKELQIQYPDFLSNIDAEKVSNNELQKALKSVNDELVNRIVIARQQDKLDDQNENVADEILRVNEARNRFRKEVSEARVLEEGFSPSDNLSELQNARMLLYRLNRDSESETYKYRQAIIGLRTSIGNLALRERLLAKEQNIANGIISERDQLMKDLGITMDKVPGPNIPNEGAKEVLRVKDLRAAISGLKKELKALTKDGYEELNQTELDNIVTKRESLGVLEQELSKYIGSTKAIKDNTDAKKEEEQALKDAFELKKYLLEQEIELSDNIFEDEQRNDDDRLTQLSYRYAKEQELAKLNYDNEINEKGISTAKKSLIDAKYEDEKATLEASFLNDRIQLLKLEELTIEELIKNREGVLETSFNNELESLNQLLLDKEISQEEHEERLFQLKKDYALRTLEMEILNLEKLLSNEDLTVSEQIELEKKLAAIRAEFSNEKVDNAKEASEDVIDLNSEEFRRASELLQELGNLGSTLYDGRIQRIDDEIQRTNDQYTNILDNENLTEQQRDAIEAERDAKNAQLEKKKREEQRKQAIFNKAMAVVEIGVQTAVNIVKAGANPILIALAAAIGAAQLAVVAATPIPRFKDGKRKGQGKDGMALVNDGGRDEIKLSADGTMTRYSGRNVLDYVKSSDTIIPNADNYMRDLNRASVMASLQNNGQNLSNSIDRMNFDTAMYNMESKMESGIKKGFKGVRMNIVNNIKTGSKDAYIASKMM